jgi:Uma2 family endonuclease
MAVMTEIPRDSKNWTVDDLERLPDDDGMRYELLDGVLLVSPAPVKKHQRAVKGLAWTLEAACPPELEILFAPFDWQPDRRNSLEPDVLVIRADNQEEKAVTEPLTLAVEVLSPSSRKRDLVQKHAKYEQAGVASYWVVDPDRPAVLAWDLVDGRYQLVGQAEAGRELRLTLPFPVTLTPSALLGPHYT